MKIVLGRFIKKKEEFDSENIVCPIKGYERDEYLNRRIFFRILFILIYGFGLGYIIGLTSVTIHDVKVIIFNFILFYICNFYLIQIPHEFFKKKCEELNIDLPGEGEYAVGMMFLPRESDEDLECEGIFETILREEGLKLLGWRDVEVDRNAIGEIAKGSEPLIKQVFIDKESYTTEEFERKLFIVRKKLK